MTHRVTLWKVVLAILVFLFVAGSFVSCQLSKACYNPTGCQRKTFYPHYETVEPMKAKGIDLPIGTIIQYAPKLDFPKDLSKPMKEKYIQSLIFPEESNVLWAGVSIRSISRFFNNEMKGFAIHPKWESMTIPKNTFEELWKHCGSELDILVHNLNDWSFNRNNIEDISSCSVVYQRGLDDDINAKRFLDTMKKAMFEYDCTTCTPIKIKFVESE